MAEENDAEKFAGFDAQLMGLEQLATLASIAELGFNLFNAHMGAGFTREQAFMLVRDWHRVVWESGVEANGGESSE